MIKTVFICLLVSKSNFHHLAVLVVGHIHGILVDAKADGRTFGSTQKGAQKFEVGIINDHSLVSLAGHKNPFALGVNGQASRLRREGDCLKGCSRDEIQLENGVEHHGRYQDTVGVCGGQKPTLGLSILLTLGRLN